MAEFQVKITDTMLIYDNMECGYRIVELNEGESFAFVWGNIKSDVGDTLPQDIFDDTTSDQGAESFSTYEEAVEAWRACAEALRQTSSPAGDEMLALLN